MTGIDKLIFKTPYIQQAESTQGYALQQTIGFAHSNGLGHEFFRLPSENRIAVRFHEMGNGGVYDGLFLKYSGYDSKFVRELVVNPSHFPSYAQMMSVLNRVASPWLESCDISRIDFCVDYEDIPFEEFISGLDIAHRSHSQIWLDCRGGVPRTLYFGAGKDKIVIYDKGHEIVYREHDGLDMGYQSIQRCRVERQLRLQSKITSAFGVRLTTQNLPAQLQRIVDGTICPFSSVSAGTVSITDVFDHDFDEDILNRGELQGMLQIASYANARRYINTTRHRNFGRYESYYERTEFPADRQPDALLRAHLDSFMRTAPHRRRIIGTNGAMPPSLATPPSNAA